MAYLVYFKIGPPFPRREQEKIPKSAVKASPVFRKIKRKRKSKRETLREAQTPAQSTG